MPARNLRVGDADDPPIEMRNFNVVTGALLLRLPDPRVWFESGTPACLDTDQGRLITDKDGAVAGISTSRPFGDTSTTLAEILAPDQRGLV